MPAPGSVLQIAVTPHNELLVFDPAVPRVYRFRMNPANQGSPMTLLLTEAKKFVLCLTMPIALERR